eukprot:15904_1
MFATVTQTIAVLMLYFVNNITSQIEAYNGPATIDYFQRELNTTVDLPVLTCKKDTTETELNLNISITNGLNNFFDHTDVSNPVVYYTLNITSEMKQLYTASLSISTCCDIDSYSYDQNRLTANVSHINNDRFCSADKSLDTYLYILQQKKKQLNLLHTADDFECSNSQKSYVNLLDYIPGVYIIAVGGYAKEYGSYYLQLSCQQYSYPITEVQFNPPINSPVISCDSMLANQFVNHRKPVRYYLLNITKTTYLPFSIASPADNDTIIYVIKRNINSYDNYDYDRMRISDIYNYTIIFDDPDVFSIGVYYVVIQGMFNQPSQFSLTITCADAPTYQPTQQPTLDPTMSPTFSPTSAPIVSVKIAQKRLEIMLFGGGSCLLILFLVYYCSKCIMLFREKKKDEEFDPIDIESSVDDNIDDKKEDEMDNEIELFRIRSVGGVDIKRIDNDVPVEKQLMPTQDTVQLVLAHAIKCCEDQNGFDIFQVLAVRYYEENSRRVKLAKPFSNMGIDMECMNLSSFFFTVFQAISIGLCQTMGISVVVYKLMYSYIRNTDIKEFVCDMNWVRWQNVFSLKILSLLLSLVITFHIGILMRGIQHNGLYEIMNKLDLSHIKRIERLSLWIIQAGQVINYYVCVFAILGSYFIIFSSNKGEDIESDDDPDYIDYSQTGLDMILNAVALFFLIELDDLMVTEQDYIDCKQHIEIVLKKYKPDVPQIGNSLHQRSNSTVEQVYNKCESCMIPFMYYLAHSLGVFATFLCYFCGALLPFVIFYCY